MGTTFPTPFLLTAPKETVSQVSPDGDLLSVRTESRQRCAGGRPRRTASAKDALLSSASFPPVPRCYEGPGQDVRPSLSGARSQDTRSAAFRCRSIVLAYSASDHQTAPSLAHAVTRRVPGARPITFCCTILRVQHRKYSPTQLTLYPTLFASVPLNPISCFAAYRNLRFAISPANLPVSIPLPVSVPQCAVQHHFYLQILFFSA